MKKLLLTVVLAYVMVFSLSAQRVEKTYHFDSPHFESYNGYETLVFDGCVQMAEDGAPSLPWQTVSLLLPFNTEATDIEYEFSDFVEIEGEHHIYPYQQPRPLSETRDIPFLKDDDIYRSEEIYPLHHEADVKTQFLNGYSVAMSGFTPVRYVPSAAKLSYAQTVKVSVSYSATRTDKSKMLKFTPEHKARVQRLAHNEDMMSSYEGRGVRTIDGYELLVVTPEEWIAHFDEYKNFYEERGLRTKVVALEDIYASSEGRDEQEKIRTFISQEYENEGVMMVLLGGDTKLVPYRGFYCYVNHEYEDHNIPADMYYACLDGNWNNDNDTLWGEVGEDDLLPELAIARMPFNDEEQFDNLMRKTLTYQTNPVLGEFDNVVFGAEHLGDGYYGKEDLELLIGKQDKDDYTTIGIPNNYMFHRYYARTENDWSGIEFRDFINEKGGGYVYHVGHANTDYVAGWYNYHIGDNAFSKLDGVNHNYNLFHSHGCICGDFSSTCILEKMINIPNGFVAATGNSRYGWYIPWGDGPARHLNRELVDSYYNDRLQYIGTAFVEMKIMTAPLVNFYGQDNSALRWNFYCINILGDVAISPWLDEPFVPDVSYKPALPLGTTNSTIIVTKDEEKQSNFRCSLFHDNQLVAFGMTDDDGKARLQFAEPLDIADTLRLVITGPNAWPQSYDVIGVDENSSYIYAEKVVINDAEGNSNAQFDYGEKVTLDVDFYNLGINDIANITATLSTTSNDIIKITNDEVSISSLTSNSTATINAAFTIEVNENAKDYEYAYFTLSCTDGENVYTQDLQYKILAPELSIVNADYDDSNGDSDGFVDIGESVQIHISGKNKGHSACEDVLIKAVSQNDNVIFSSSEKSISRVEAGANMIAAFTFTMDESTPEGSIIDIDVIIVSGVYMDKKTIRFTAGNVSEDFETADLSNHKWINDDVYPWFITDEDANNGTYSIQSAQINKHERTRLQIEIESMTDGEISFYLKTSTVEDRNFLAFFVDDDIMGRWSGENDWQRVSFPIMAGNHTLEWLYDKSREKSDGEDFCRIDDIVFPGNSVVMSVNTVMEENNVTLYPNPTDGFFRLEGENLHGVDIYSMMGNKIMSQDVTSSNVVNIVDLPNGLYLVRIFDNDNNVIVRKIVKK